jgi:UDP-glucose 4-epimerase
MTALSRILVTGGAGFIGSATVDLLLKKGKQVVVLDNLFSGKVSNLDLTNPCVEFVEGDVLEYSLLESLVKTCDAVLHLAAIASVPFSIENPMYTLQVNTQGFLHVLEAVRKAGHPVRLVYASSAAVYGDDKDLPCRDDKSLPELPLSPYALQKWHCEQYAALYNQLHKVPSLGLRYFNVYGEKQDPASPYSGVISRFLEAYKQDKELKIFGDGKQSRDFIYVNDVANANLLALKAECKGAMNIATGKPETLLQLAEYIKQAGARQLKLKFEPSRAGDIRESYAATQLALHELGFKYDVPLQQGIKTLLP